METFDTLNIESFFGVEIAFVLDSTGSMLSYIQGAKQSIKEIISKSQLRFKNFKADQDMLRFAIVAYRDHAPQENTFVTKIHNFSNADKIVSFLDSLSACGGGDPPEAVLDGLYDAVYNINWREESEKMLFLLLDNPGHGIRFGTSYDCICGYHEKNILPLMKQKQINFHIIRPKEFNSKLDKMINIFEEYIDIKVIELEGKTGSERITDGIPHILNRKYTNLRINHLKNKNRKYSDYSFCSSKSESYMSKSRSRSRSRSRSNDKTSVKYYKSDLIIKSTLPYVNIEAELLDSFNIKKINKEEKLDKLEEEIKDYITRLVIDKLDKCLKITDN